MNKKFSTLLASALLAGAWTTLDAAVVETTPVIGGTYAIGAPIEGDKMQIWGTSTMKLGNAAVVTSSNANFLLEAVAGEDGVFYLKAGRNYLMLDNVGTNGWLKFANTGNKIKFKLENGQLVYSAVEGTTSSFTGKLHVNANDEVRIPYAGYDMPADAKALTFAVWNDDVAFAGSNLALQKTITDGEYYVIAATGQKVLKDDGQGNVTTYAMVVEADLDKVLWKISTGKAADGTTVTYKFTNKASGKVLKIENRDNFIVAGSPASFTLGVGEGQLLTADLKVGTATQFGVYKSPIVKLNSDKLNALLNKGFNMTIQVKKGDNTVIKGAEAFAGDLVAVKDNATRFQLMSGDKYVVLNKKNTWGDNLGAPNNRGAKFELVDDLKADHLSYFEFTQYAGCAENLIELVTVFADETGSPFGNLFVQKFGEEVGLTTSLEKDADDVLTETWPYITLGADNIIDPAKFLKKGYAVIKQLNDEGAEDDLLVVAAGCETAGITVAETVTNDLEKQWLVSYDKDTKQYTLTNRENTGVQKTGISYAALRDNDDATDNIYVYGGNEYEITFHDFDASSNYYKVLAENAADLVDSTFVITYWSTVFDGYANVSANDDNVAFIGTKATPVEFKAASSANFTATGKYTYWTGSEFKTEDAKLEAPIYTFATADGKFAEGDNDKYVVNDAAAQSIVIRKAGDHYNLMTVAEKAMTGKIYVGNNDSYIYNVPCMYADNKNTLFMVETNNRPEYRRLGKTIEDGFNDMEGELNILKFFRTNDENQFLYENSANRNANNGKACLNFLGETNLADKPADAQLPFLVDTAFVRNNTRKPLYMLSVRSEYKEAGEETIPCPEHGYDCEHAYKVPTPAYRTGDYLVALDDSVATYPQAKYQGNTRLAFVPAKHIADTLVILNSNGEKGNWFANDSIIFADANGKQIDATPAAFAFRLVDPTAVDENKAEFIIENVKDKEVRYVRIHNTVPVLVTNRDEAAVFDVTAAAKGESATDNEEIATSEVTVIAGEGQLTIANAAGKKVVVSNILGQVVANTVLSSDNATIAAPQGVVVVAVEGEEAVKAIVK